MTAGLAGVRVHGMTRAAFMTRGALAAASAYGLGAVAPWVQRAVAQESGAGGDTGIVQFAISLEYLEAAFYKRGLKEVPGLSGDVKDVVTQLRDQEADHVDMLISLLNQLGAGAATPPKFDFGGAFDSEATFLQLAQTFEDTGVQAYNGVGPAVQSPDVLGSVASIVQVEGRHAGVIRDIRGAPITPGAFDRGASRQIVLERVKPFTG
jgi:rubrerythrin